MTYSEKLLDQRWQKKRLELLTAAKWTCCNPFCTNGKPNPTLHVHHRIYIRGMDPWNYEDWMYDVLCDECHQAEQALMHDAYYALAKHPRLLNACAAVNLITNPSIALQTVLSLHSLAVWFADHPDDEDAALKLSSFVASLSFHSK